MAKYFKYLLSLSLIHLLMLSASSCQEGGEAGDLFGQWRMDNSDTHYISFSGSIVRIHDLHTSQVFGNFQHQGDSLFMQCYSINGDPADTVAVEQSFGFRPIDNIRLRINELSSDRLVLSKDGQTWSFSLY